MNIRKILLSSLIIVLIFTLSGCFLLPSNSDDIPIIKDEDRTIHKDKLLEINNIATTHTVSATTLQGYSFEENLGITYVNIEEFLLFLKQGLIHLTMDITEDFEITYSFNVPVDYYDILGVHSLEYSMVLDHEDNTIYLEDFSLLSSLNYGYSLPVNENYYLESLEKTEANKEVTIDLDDYNMDILFEFDEYYIPLYLANLFFTGLSINVYEMNDTLFVIDYGTDFADLEANFELNTSLDINSVLDHTTDYLGLYFDYFYGLKEYQGVESYIDILDDYSFSESSSFRDYNLELKNFLGDQNDLHTIIVSGGFADPDIDVSANYTVDSKLYDYLYSYNNNACFDRTEEVDYYYTNNMSVISVNSFTNETESLVAEYVDLVSPTDTVVLDLSCNSGGSLSAIVNLMRYFTNEGIPIKYLNSQTLEITEEIYSSHEDIAFENDLVLITSTVSYSAANIFASIFKDLELGIIIGENSLGGAGAVISTVLPNGVVIYNSSNMTFLNEDNQLIEDGIEVDIEYRLPIDYDALSFKLDSYFKLATEFNITNTEYRDFHKIQFDILFQDDAVDIIEYKLYVYNKFDDSLLGLQSYDGEFNVNIEMNDLVTDYYIEVYVSYSYNGIAYYELIHEYESE